MRLARWMLLCVPVALAAGCGGSAPAPADAVAAPAQPAAAPAEPSATAEAEAASAGPALPDTRAGQQLAWVLEVLRERNGAVEPAELEAHFHPSFLGEVPPEALAQVFAQLGAAPVALTAVAEGGTDTELAASVTAAGTALRVSIALDDASGQIVGLLFRPEAAPEVTARSFEEAVALVEKLSGEASLLVAEIDDAGRCVPLHHVDADRSLAIGSAFKLYVLLGVADAIAAGRLGWDREIAIRDEWKSLPSGVTQNDAAGTKRSVRHLAGKMISISDNTATDHLLYTVGRRRVERAVRAAGHANPAVNAPFVSTRELFLLKMSLPDDEVKRYIALAPQKRRAYLDRELAGKMPELGDAATWTAPRYVAELEWFASASDLCRTMATLRERSDKPKLAPILEVLAENPGLPQAAKAFAYAGFKGGSEPGVINLSWLLRREDGRWFSVVLTVNDEAAAVEEGAVLGIAKSLLSLVAEAPR